MSFPSRYREELVEHCAGEVVVTVDPDRCLLVYPLPQWEEIEQKLIRLPSLKPQTRRLQRLLMGHANEAQLDGSGRILLPTPLRDFAGLDKKVVLIGQGNKFELWDETEWKQRCDKWLVEAAEDFELSEELESLSL